MKKGDIAEIIIDGITHDGKGVGRLGGITVFVKYALLGEKVQIMIIKSAKNYLVGRLMKIIEQSPHRIEPDCPVYNKCGGCNYRHTDYEEELLYKKMRVSSAVSRIGGCSVEVSDTVPSPAVFHYRNKSQIPFALTDNGRIELGFFRERSHDIAPFENCLIQNRLFNDIALSVKEFADEVSLSVYNEKTRRGLLRHLYIRLGEKTGQFTVCLVINGKNLPEKERLIKKLSVYDGFCGLILNINTDDTNVILGDKNIILYGSPYIEDILCGKTFKISFQSFYQVNRAQAERIYTDAIESLSLCKEDTLLDLYCGVGTMGIIASEKAGKVIGVEICPEAVEDARSNAVKNDIQNVQYICRDAALIKREELGADNLKVIFDPPRKGCDEGLINIITYLKPSKISYISCNPETLARDIKILSEKGYNVISVTPYDMFPRTYHVEVLTILEFGDTNNE